MNQRSRCPSCNGKETWADYYCAHCDYNWEEEAYLEPDGTIRKSPCPRCLKDTPAEGVRCANPTCMAVWPPPEPLT